MATIIRVPINLRTMHRFSKRRNRWFTKIALRSPLPLSNPPLSSARSIFIELPPYSYSVRTVQLESLSLHLRFHFIVIKGTTDRKATLSFYIFFLAFTSKPTTSRLILVSDRHTFIQQQHANDNKYDIRFRFVQRIIKVLKNFQIVERMKEVFV